MTGRNELHPEVERVREWLTTSEAVAYSTARISRSSLPLGAEELRDEALFRVWEMFERNPDREPLENVAAYTKTIMARICAGKKQDEEVTDPAKMRRKSEPEKDSRPDRSDDALHLRTLVEIGPGRSEIKAAVLNVLTLSDPDIDRSDLPRPRQGSKPEHARWWPAAYLATRDPKLFPQQESSTSAQRQRFRRFMNECEQLVNTARFSFVRKERQDG